MRGKKAVLFAEMAPERVRSVVFDIHRPLADTPYTLTGLVRRSFQSIRTSEHGPSTKGNTRRGLAARLTCVRLDAWPEQ